MEEVLLISAEKIRTQTNISSNLQDKFMNSAIKEATNNDLEEIVGSPILEKLKSLVKAKTITEPANMNYKRLLDRCQYFLMYSTIKRLIVMSSIHIGNIGANQINNQDAKVLDMKELWQLEDYYENQANYYKKKLQLFILENFDYYPELEEEKWTDVRHNLYASDSCPIFLGGKRGKPRKTLYSNR